MVSSNLCRFQSSTPQAHSIWASERGRRGGRTRIPGGRWRPLKVASLGLEVAHLRRGEFERVVGAAASRPRRELQLRAARLDPLVGRGHLGLVGERVHLPRQPRLQLEPLGHRAAQQRRDGVARKSRRAQRRRGRRAAAPLPKPTTRRELCCSIAKRSEASDSYIHVFFLGRR